MPGTDYAALAPDLLTRVGGAGNVRALGGRATPQRIARKHG